MTEDEKIELAKQIIGFIAGIGVSAIVHGAVRSHVIPTNNLQRPFIFVGRYTLASIMTEISKKHTDEKVDSAVNWWKEYNDGTEISRESE